MGSHDVEGRAWSSGPHGREPTEPAGENLAHSLAVLSQEQRKMWICGRCCDRNGRSGPESCHKSNGKCGFVGILVTENDDLSQDSVTRATENVGL